MGKKTTAAPGAPPTDTAPALTITALHWVGPRWLPELGKQDMSRAEMDQHGLALYTQAVTSGWYKPTPRHIRAVGLPAHERARDLPTELPDAVPDEKEVPNGV